MVEQITTLIIIPICVGIAIELFAWWWSKRNDD